MGNALQPGHPVDLVRLVFEAVGYASMCWKPTPSGVFDTTAATTCAERLIADVCAAYGPRTAPVQPVPLVQALDGLLASMGREPTEAELRAAAHALTVRADKVAAAVRVMGFASGAAWPPDVTDK